MKSIGKGNNIADYYKRNQKIIQYFQTNKMDNSLVYNIRGDNYCAERSIFVSFVFQNKQNSDINLYMNEEKIKKYFSNKELTGIINGNWKSRNKNINNAPIKTDILLNRSLNFLNDIKSFVKWDQKDFMNKMNTEYEEFDLVIMDVLKLFMFLVLYELYIEVSKSERDVLDSIIDSNSDMNSNIDLFFKVVANEEMDFNHKQALDEGLNILSVFITKVLNEIGNDKGTSQPEIKLLATALNCEVNIYQTGNILLDLNDNVLTKITPLGENMGLNNPCYIITETFSHYNTLQIIKKKSTPVPEIQKSTPKPIDSSKSPIVQKPAPQN